MAEGLRVPKGEWGVLRVFAVDPHRADLSTWVRDLDAPMDAELAPVLGQSDIPPQCVELLRLSDVAALGLRDFLIEGHDVRPEALDERFSWLDQLTGFVLIVHPAIATVGPVNFHDLPEGVSFVGAFAQVQAAPPPLSLPEPEKPQTLSGPAAPPGKKGAGTAAVLALFIVLLLLMVFVLGVPIWPF
jgi:hypothetical protein